MARALVVICLLLACAVSAKPSWDQLEGYTFEKYLQDFGKNYTETEFDSRKEIFTTRIVEIQQHNEGESTYKMGVNFFTDLSSEEFEQYTGYDKKLTGYANPDMVLSSSSPFGVDALPQSVDWRTKGIVSPVKNQGGCGSCWAFAATETLESYVTMTTGELLTLSPQNLVSCSKNPDNCGGTGGCGGSIPELAYDYVRQSGQALESDYPYTARDGPCQSVAPKVKISGYVKLQENSYEAVLTAVATIGPLAVSIAASPIGGYERGVFDGCSLTSASGTDINHVVQLVGYGTDPSDGDYWIVRNSWGTSWGEAGYIRMKRYGKTSHCGTDHTPADGTACKPYPSEVSVCGECGILYDTVYPTGATIIG